MIHRPDRRPESSTQSKGQPKHLHDTESDRLLSNVTDKHTRDWFDTWKKNPACCSAFWLTSWSEAQLDSFSFNKQNPTSSVIAVILLFVGYISYRNLEKSSVWVKTCTCESVCICVIINQTKKIYAKVNRGRKSILFLAHERSKINLVREYIFKLFLSEIN